MSSILGIDPGTTQSGWCWMDEGKLVRSGVMSNGQMIEAIQTYLDVADVLAIEMVASYGMAVGKEVFETVRWIGRMQQTWLMPDDVMLIYRKDVKMHLCGTMKAKDGNIRQAIIDLFPATGGGKVPQIGVKSKPGPLYGVSSHAWPAIAVAITARHQLESA